MTTTIVIGEFKETKKLKPIRFERCLNIVGCTGATGAVVAATNRPSSYSYIELICKNYQPGNDLMFAYNNPLKREEGMLYIGKWNDGVVE